MKTNATFLSALGAAALIGLFGLYCTSVPGDQAASAARFPERGRPGPAGPAVQPGEVGSDSGTGRIMDSNSPPEVAASPARDRDVVAIPPEMLRNAQRMAEEMAAHRERNRAIMADANYQSQSVQIEKPAKMLALRLKLNPGAAKEVESILAAEAAARIETQWEMERQRMEREAQTYDEDREGYVSYLALQAMMAQGMTLSREQEDLYNRIRHRVSPNLDSSAPAMPAEWYENQPILDAMGRHLSPEEKSELDRFVVEQKNRDREALTMQAYMRSSRIAERLGLDDEDRNTLYEFIRAHPDASRSEIVKIVAPELRDLLPAGM